jgi:hypothetical protein
MHRIQPETHPFFLYRLIVTPKGRLTTLERPLLDMPWHTARPSVKVKLLARDGETYVLAQSATLTYQLDRHTLRVAWRREGRYLLRANITDTDPVKMWEYYLQLTEIEQAFKDLPILLRQIQLTLPEQVTPKIRAPVPTSNKENPVVPTF